MIVAGKRKQEVGFLVMVKHVASTNSRTFANYFIEEITRKGKKKHPKFEFDIITTTVIHNGTTCEIVYIN